MSEELLINVNPFETRAALLQDGVLQELHIARSSGYSYTGNIYLGRVERIVAGMQAAFVDVGLERPGFLHVRNLVPSVGARDVAGDHPLPDIRDLVHEGQELLVQVTKDPISSKGVRLTAEVSVAARYAVLMPFGSQIGVSQRIGEEAERERLRGIISEAQRKLNTSMGFIARTVSEGVDAEVIESDMAQLLRVWGAMAVKRADLRCPAPLHEDLPLHIRLLRDLAGPDLTRIRIDDERTCRRAARFAAQFLPEVARHVEHYCEPRPLFDRYGIEDQAARALQPRVEMKCGGFLVIEQTEAMVTIDVNTGSFVGGSRFEETVYRTNLEAASVIPRQLRLRNLGGIIVIDFIDMESPEHQRNVLRALEKASEGDRARLAFEGFSSLGLVQMSRKRTRESLAHQLCEPCPLCHGGGLTKTSETICAEIFRAIVHDARTACSPSAREYLIRAPETVVDRLLDEDADHLAAVSSRVGREIRIQVEPCYGPNQFDVVVLQEAGR
ncbi:MAG: Rne/Rng family ribonuclease [Gammaproteobacteria bacterium]|nr:Rne/Rng family ribonuclease [Gammaproteobacteria bacterium]MCY4342835.1 Rne/Rng family ribonuclease [Gammaproteobacteria bacterium]